MVNAQLGAFCYKQVETPGLRDACSDNDPAPLTDGFGSYLLYPECDGFASDVFNNSLREGALPVKKLDMFADGEPQHISKVMSLVGRQFDPTGFD